MARLTPKKPCWFCDGVNVSKLRRTKTSSIGIPTVCLQYVIDIDLSILLKNSRET